MSSLYALSSEDLKEELNLEKKFQGKIVYSWLIKGATTFDEMTNLSKIDRERLSKEYPSTLSSKVIEKRESPSTKKLAIELEDGNIIECVLLSDAYDRHTACLSTQVGCAMGCAFCSTGTMSLVRNLSAGEIVEQFVHLKKIEDNITHIVFMGMGEPLNNFNPLMQAISHLHSPEGFNISHRRITISTSGLITGIKKLAELNLGLKLAVSLVSANNATRNKLMLVNRTNNLFDLKSALLNFQRVNDKRITLEYCLLSGVNTTKESAKELANFTNGLFAIVNLIPWNPVDDLEYTTPTDEEIDRFTSYLDTLKVNYTLRRTKGREIDGACGQLRSKIVNKKGKDEE